MPDETYLISVGKVISPLLALALLVSLVAVTLPFSPVAAQGEVELWNKTYDGYGDDEPRAVVVDSKDNVIVTGFSSNGGTADWHTIKYDPDGIVIWSKTYGDSHDARAGAVAVDSKDNVIVTGFSSNGGTADWHTIKYDPDGIVIWSRTYDGGYDDWAFSVAMDSEDNVIVTGDSLDEGDWRHWNTIKYDPDGIVIWSKRFSGSVSDVAVDSKDNVIVIGYSQEAPLDYYTIKYDPDGAAIWSRTYDGGYLDSAHAVAVDSKDNVVVVGNSYDDTIYNYGTMTIKYDPDGTIIWSSTYDSGHNARAGAVAVDSEDNAIVTGYLISNYYTIKYDPDGTIIWSSTYDGGYRGRPYGVAVDSEDNVIVIGNSYDGTTWNWCTIKYGVSVQQPAEGSIYWIAGPIIGGIAVVALIIWAMRRKRAA